MHSPTCQRCGRPIVGRKETARYCSDRCSALARHIWLRYHATAIYPTWEALVEQHRPRRGGTTTEEMVRSVCESLGTYTYHEVRNALMKQTKVLENKKARGNVGCYVPTERQLQYILSRSDWSRQIAPPTKHRPAKYEYRGTS